MCTIGAVYDGERMVTFKQCDLTRETEFFEPEVKPGDGGIQYVDFGRAGSDGPWCGVNNYGVAFVAADAYMSAAAGPRKNDDAIFSQYRHILSAHSNAKSAAEAMTAFYKVQFKEPDILLISDESERYYLEAYQGEVICVRLADKEGCNYFVATNHFRYIHGGVTYPENHSTYLRLARAEEILLKDPTCNGVENLLQDQYYGASVLSVCRDNRVCPRGEAPYKTMATAIFIVEKNEIKYAYQLNGNPRSNEFSVNEDLKKL